MMKATITFPNPMGFGPAIHETVEGADRAGLEREIKRAMREAAALYHRQASEKLTKYIELSGGDMTHPTYHALRRDFDRPADEIMRVLSVTYE